MFGSEPPQPKLWKALLGAGIITFPLLYVADAAIWRHTPGIWYLLIASAVTFVLGYQMYSGGIDSLRPMRGFSRGPAISSEAASLIPKANPSDLKDED